MQKKNHKKHGNLEMGGFLKIILFNNRSKEQKYLEKSVEWRVYFWDSWLIKHYDIAHAFTNHRI